MLKAVPLAYPVTHGGRDWSAIHIRRFSVEQIAAIMDNYRTNLKLDPEAEIALPLYVDEAGNDLPDGLLNKLDADDSEELSRQGADFLPRRFRVDSVTTSSVPETSSPSSGEVTSPSAVE